MCLIPQCLPIHDEDQEVVIKQDGHHHGEQEADQLLTDKQGQDQAQGVAPPAVRGTKSTAPNSQRDLTILIKRSKKDLFSPLK